MSHTEDAVAILFKETGERDPELGRAIVPSSLLNEQGALREQIFVTLNQVGTDRSFAVSTTAVEVDGRLWHDAEKIEDPGKEQVYSYVDCDENGRINI
ncbi:hypothetical protein HOF56_01120 [Candidatus Peribacteria bacterium]|jgi:hypothetical protein|nr:hypothetical protein [Candidatus Peribacteria bacterium]MBT4020928.1 hypothetical protein [Candidatus Peribacteria bacterium]MBT4240486.1 hypothetical protein [Candidatus Peribacteria bacterium]MBT4474370.1 hypothetical protein [Candidatus Peribacteria bacterium]